MDRKEFTFFVKSHERKRNEKGIVTKLVLVTGAGHKLTFKGESEDLFVGFPVGQAVGVKLTSPQTTLPVEE